MLFMPSLITLDHITLATLVSLNFQNQAWTFSGSEKPRIKLSSPAIGYGVGGFVAIDFNRDDFLCVFVWVHIDWSSQREIFF
jgi:hypothetical protein